MKPILFNTEMVRAILDGRKTVTRRAIKPQTVTSNTPDGQVVRSLDDFIASNAKDAELPCAACSPYQVGDVLYVRETWAPFGQTFLYRANGGGHGGNGWHPSIHMPKEAARIFLRVTGVRVEKLQDISLYGVWDEGTPQAPGNSEPEKAVNHVDFKYLWDSTVKKQDIDQYGWNANPWVWVIEFERIEKP